MTKIAVSQDPLDVIVAILAKTENITQLPEDSARVPPCEALIAVEPRRVSPGVAYQPEATVPTIACLPTIGHETLIGLRHILHHLPILEPSGP